MKEPKTTFLAVRLTQATRDAFLKKAKAESNHDASSVLRNLIDIYLADLITIERTTK